MLILRALMAREVFVLQECARLLPNLRLMLVLYGKNSSPLLDDVWEKENLCISIRHQLYHESSDLKPHFAVGKYLFIATFHLASFSF